jgi:hypothetical protein
MMISNVFATEWSIQFAARMHRGVDAISPWNTLEFSMTQDCWMASVQRFRPVLSPRMINARQINIHRRVDWVSSCI